MGKQPMPGNERSEIEKKNPKLTKNELLGPSQRILRSR